jgi:beta-glucosidase
VAVSFTVTNTGARAGYATPQIYVGGEGWEAPRRLGGFKKLALKPGETRRVSLSVDPRLLSVWDAKAHGWKRAGGDYQVWLAASSRDLKASTKLTLPAQALPAGYHPAK